MTDAELRALVRDIVARQLGVPAVAADRGASAVTPRQACVPAPPPAQALSVQVRLAPLEPTRHTSHAQFVMGAASPGEPMPCVIEPAVPCDHCGYCKSLGH